MFIKQIMLFIFYDPYRPCLFTNQRSGVSYLRVAARSTLACEKKPSLRISNEAVRNALGETRREDKRVAFPLQRTVSFETSHISFDDRFAALQIDFGRWRLETFGRLTRSSLTYFESLIQLYSQPLQHPRKSLMRVTSTYYTKNRVEKSMGLDLL